jgi:hypothetical protein
MCKCGIYGCEETAHYGGFIKRKDPFGFETGLLSVIPVCKRHLIYMYGFPEKVRDLILQIEKRENLVFEEIYIEKDILYISFDKVVYKYEFKGVTNENVLHV